MKKDNNGNGILIIVLLVIVVIFVLFFPKINNYVISLSMPEVEEIIDNDVEEKKEITEDILETIHYPMMRNSIYNSSTYYSLDVFTTSNLTNEDILLTAFLDIYKGNLTNYNGWASCTKNSKQFNKKYLNLRIRNIISSNIEYNFEDFYVPEDLDTPYVGNWKYDATNSRYIYNGLCSSKATNTKYYDLEELIKIEYEGNDIVVYYYVGFAKVEGNNYTIYKSADYNEILATGIYSSRENLDIDFKNIDSKNKKIYKYTFKNTICKYDEYCLHEGRWVSEL